MAGAFGRGPRPGFGGPPAGFDRGAAPGLDGATPGGNGGTVPGLGGAAPGRGGDPAPTLEQFQRCVAEGRVHWFIGGGGFGASQGGGDAARQIAAWVQQTFQAMTIDGATVYDLTAQASS